MLSEKLDYRKINVSSMTLHIKNFKTYKIISVNTNSKWQLLLVGERKEWEQGGMFRLQQTL